jgi:hypothetical protein
VPRLSNTAYCGRHEFLQRAWYDFQIIYTILSPQAQWDLHDYYRPQDDLSTERLITHREAITKQFPSLPNKAGKSYLYIHDICVLALEQADTEQDFRDYVKRFVPITSKSITYPVVGRHKAHNVHITSLVNPTIDTQKLTVAIWLLAEQMLGKYPTPEQKDSRITNAMALALPSHRPPQYKQDGK